MTDGRPGRGSDQFPLRLPDGMRDRLKDEAQKNKRSMNAEIIARLEASFTAPFREDVLVNQDFVDAFRKWISEEFVLDEGKLHLKTGNKPKRRNV